MHQSHSSPFTHKRRRHNSPFTQTTSTQFTLHTDDVDTIHPSHRRRRHNPPFTHRICSSISEFGYSWKQIGHFWTCIDLSLLVPAPGRLKNTNKNKSTTLLLKGLNIQNYKFWKSHIPKPSTFMTKSSRIIIIFYNHRWLNKLCRQRHRRQNIRQIFYKS